MVNRIWQHHFGRGIVRDAEQFRQDGRASHASRNCSITWRRASWRTAGRSSRCIARSCSRRSTQLSAEDDPGERRRWTPTTGCSGAPTGSGWMPRSLRDSLLFVSGNLDLQAGGPPAEARRQEPRGAPSTASSAAASWTPCWRCSISRIRTAPASSAWSPTFRCSGCSS